MSLQPSIAPVARRLRAHPTDRVRLLATALIVACTPALLTAQATGITGVVFVDRNGNGVRDAGEPGQPNVVISDQHQVTTTAADGTFTLRVEGAGLVFVSVPDGYRSVGEFWRAVDGSAPRPLAFALATAPASRSFTFVHASDSHVSERSVVRLRRARAIVDSIAPDFVLITGDLVRDALRVGEREASGYFELFAAEVGAFRTPVWTVPGNHENFGIERDTSHVPATHPLYGRAMYHHYRGPDYYSFTHGGVHFVGLNTADIDDQRYYGHVDAAQLEWLARDLEQVPATMPVVTFDHIPFFTAVETINGYMDRPPAPSVITVGGKAVFRHSVSNAGEVLAVLRRHRHVLALGGHMHVRETLHYEIDGMPIRLEQAAAIVGPSEGAGLHFRSGLTVYRVRDGVIGDGVFVPLDVNEARK